MIQFAMYHLHGHPAFKTRDYLRESGRQRSKSTGQKGVQIMGEPIIIFPPSPAGN